MQIALNDVEKYIYNTFKTSVDFINTQTDLSPNNKVVDNCIHNLMDISLNYSANNDNCDNLIRHFKKGGIVNKFRDIFCRSIIEREKYFGRKFLSIKNMSYEDLKLFWDFDKNNHLVSREKDLIDTYTKGVKDIVFIGSGPIPLTGIILDNLSKGTYKIDLVDKDEESQQIAAGYCNKFSNNMNFIIGEAIEQKYSKYDLAIVASMLIGKQEVVKKLYNNGVKYIIARDAKNISQLFHEPINVSKIKGYRVVSFSSGGGKSVNSSYLLERI